MSNVIQLPYYDAADVDAICGELRSGRGAFVLFGDSPTAFLEVAGPKGHPAWNLLCRAPHPQVSLHTTEHPAPIAVAAANREFPRGLDEIAGRGAPLLGSNTPLLLALLAALRDATVGMRLRVPTVGDLVTEEGAPTMVAWSSCLPLGALQAAIQRATRIRSAA